MDSLLEGENGKRLLDALISLTEQTSKSKNIKYNYPMKVKTFVFKYDSSLDLGDLPEADNAISDFIKDKLVIDIHPTRLDENHITYIVMYKEGVS